LHFANQFLIKIMYVCMYFVLFYDFLDQINVLYKTTSRFNR